MSGLIKGKKQRWKWAGDNDVYVNQYTYVVRKMGFPYKGSLYYDVATMTFASRNTKRRNIANWKIYGRLLMEYNERD